MISGCRAPEIAAATTSRLRWSSVPPPSRSKVRRSGGRPARAAARVQL